MWNVRGVGTSQGRIGKLVKKHNVTILGIAEPFHREDKMKVLAQKIKLPNFISNEKEGGKLWVFWSEDYKVDWVHFSNQALHGVFRKGEYKMLVSFIYAKCNALDRRTLWQELERIRMIGFPWVVSGDFNIIRNDTERIGGCPRPLQAMEDFNDCIDRCGLLELSVMGQKLSWCNGHEGLTRSWARLDRTLVSDEVFRDFPDAGMKYLSGMSSDHRPMIIHLQKQFISYGPSPFRFQRMWCEHELFLPCVEAAWKSHDRSLVLGGLEKLAAKLKVTKEALKVWNKQVFKRVDNVILELEEHVEALDSRLQCSEDVEQEFLNAKIELEEWQRREEIRLAQLAKKKWLTDGDKNSKFYQISKEKSAIFFSKSCSVAQKGEVLRESSFKEGQFPVIYLGVPVVQGRLTARHLEPLVEKTRKKIAVGCIPEVINNSQWRIREGSISFWFAHWLEDGPLSRHVSHIDQPALKIKDVCLDSGWNVDKLLQLVGEDKAASVMAKVSKCREGEDVLIWKPSSRGNFSSSGAWDMIRVRSPQTSWAKWVWHSAIPKRMLVLMWKALSGALSVDNRVRQMGVSLASRCDCCLMGMEETISHVLSTGDVANEVWRKMSGILGIRWRSKQMKEGSISFWFAHWLEDGPLSRHVSHIDQPALKIKDVCLDSGWNVDKLLQLGLAANANAIPWFYCSLTDSNPRTIYTQELLDRMHDGKDDPVVYFRKVGD
ncbi:unnamed protein product [Fraxinus pennsylvanica]|uniref:Reverse transcriptase zinc-binding domain-containing protein n=1 Tax=Fraxinus pennsylvanica TaxID=56036 RepID=A0AAD2DI60_9LAMI|nr:unnamed protein product [Fraxinus pennsylvanica]